MLEAGVYTFIDATWSHAMDLSGKDNRSLIAYPKHGLDNQMVSQTLALGINSSRSLLTPDFGTVGSHSPGSRLFYSQRQVEAVRDGRQHSPRGYGSCHYRLPCKLGYSSSGRTHKEK